MIPVTPTGRTSVFSLPRYWYAACFASALRRRPIGRVVHGVPLVLFRDAAGRPAALLDRCPHRNAPLSIGRCEGGELQCAYHGWRFDREGACVAVPGLSPDGTPPARQYAGRPVDAFRAFECDGIVWVVPSAEAPVIHEPPMLPHVDTPGYATVRRTAQMQGSVHAAIENALDVPHTSFLHRGLLRGRRKRVAVEATIRHTPGRVEAIFEGEPRPPGLAARLLSPGGGVVEHVDRFVLPSLSQVEYRLGDNHLVITTAFTPVRPAVTMLHATVTFRVGAPTWLVRAVVSPIAGQILRQDARIIRAQAENIERFGGERFANTPIDLLGPHILRMLRRAERGPTDDAQDDVPADERVTLYT
ncbi:MAG TPA: Rieske 2Fe-2S domain-containing protein [Acidimicrobiales bacterium]|jgi:phenylpropionate dioxygenase-like ring-hydroxylating dioxygenase large terminal subunit|nr:Rieske 2Fe-2S domain-containing protein [Acidimicrobiales bacterium]